MKTTTSSIESLEPRIAPAATFVNPTTATYTDADGDHVTVKSSKPILSMANVGNVLITAAAGFGDQLQEIDLTGLVAAAKGTNITVTARPGPLGGDGFANIGWIIGTGIDLGAVTLHGDLGRITAGDNTVTPAMKSLNVHSIGRFGTTTGAPDLVSNILGALGALNVKGDVAGADIMASSIGSVTIGGSLRAGSTSDSGEIFCEGNIGPVRIGHDVVGGPQQRSGLIESDSGTIASVAIGGSLFGGNSNDTGEIFSFGDLGMVKIGHDVKGNVGVFSAIIRSVAGKMAGVSIGGSLRGGASDHCGAVSSNGDLGAVNIRGDVRGNSGPSSGLVTSGGGIASVKIGGSLTGGSGAMSGSLISGKKLGPVQIGGDFRASTIEGGAGVTLLALTSVTIGGFADGASIDATGDIGAVKIGHDVTNGAIEASATLQRVSIGGSVSSSIITDSGNIQSVRIGGSATGNLINPTVGGIGTLFIGGSADGDTIAMGGFLGALMVNGDFSNVSLYTVGQAAHSATSDMAIGSMTIGGRVENSEIRAGYNGSGAPVDGNAQIGAVKVGGDWITSDLVAGVVNTNGNFADGDDAAFAGSTISKIASIVIGGQVLGNTTGGTYGFEAGRIGSFKVGGFALALKPGAHNDTFGGLGVAGSAIPVGSSLSNKVDDGFAVHVFEV